MKIRTLVREEIVKGFYHIWVWRSCDLDAPNKLSFPLHIDTPHKIYLRLANLFLSRICLKLWTDGQTDGQTPEHMYTIKLANEIHHNNFGFALNKDSDQPVHLTDSY